MFDQDPQRVCILQGPVAVKHSTVKDEPIGELLGNVTAKLVEKLVERSYGGDTSKIPTVDYLAPPAEDVDIPDEVECEESSISTTYNIGNVVPETSEWLEAISGSELNWLKALLTSKTICQGQAYIDNPLRRALTPRRGQRVVVNSEGEYPTSVTVYGAGRSYGFHKSDFKAIEIAYAASSSLIDVTLVEDRRAVSVPLFLRFRYVPSMGSMPIHEVSEGRNGRIKDFYWGLWFGDDQSRPELDIRETFIGPEVVISANDVETFCNVVGNQNEAFKTARTEIVKAPMDFAIVTGWQVSTLRYCCAVKITLCQAIMRSIFPDAIDGDLLKLVHLSNGFRLVPGAKPLRAGDACIADAHIASVKNTDAGKVVQVKGHVFRDGQPIIEVVSSFLYRGRFDDYEHTFETVDEPDYVVQLINDAAVGVVQSKEWLSWEDETIPPKAGMTLVFRIQSQVTFKDKTSYRDICVSGDVYMRDQLKRLKKVASVEFNQEGCHGNPVVEYLQRHGVPEGRLTPLTNGGYTMSNNAPTTFTTPLSNEPYSVISGDFNPIHVNPYFADFAALPGTITHGMWSSAATRRYVENIVAEGNPDRVIA